MAKKSFHSKRSMVIKEKKSKLPGYIWLQCGDDWYIYVSCGYVQHLQTLFQQNNTNNSFRETVRPFKRIVEKTSFSDPFRKIIKHYKRVGYSIDAI